MDEHVESLRAVPTISLSLLRQDSHTRFLTIKKIREACHTYGFFHVINHGIHESVLEDALNVNAKFFEMPEAEKEELISDDVFKVVRFGHVFVGDYSKDFLKLYAHPLEDFISYWPSFPREYREKMGIYSTEARKLCIEVYGARMESLNLDQARLKQEFEQGTQMLGINCYPPSESRPSTKIGTPPHTDHSIVTLLLQSGPGLDVLIHGRRSWERVPELKGSLQVLVGDHLEVISNGFYRSVMHRAIPTCDGARFSIGSFHSLAMDEVVEPAAELEREGNRRRYRGSSLRDFVNHLASRDARAFINTLKIHDVDS